MKIIAVIVLGILPGVFANSAANAQACPDTPSLHFSIERAIQECTGAIHNINNGRGALPEWRAAGYYDRGLLYHLSGKLDLAIADYTSAIGWQSDFADAYEARGDAYEDIHQHNKAVSDYATAAQLTIDHPDAIGERCWVRAVRGRPFDRALADCNEALKELPGNPDMLEFRCFLYYRMGDDKAAIADCSAAEKAQSRFADALYVGGLAKLRSGDTAGGNADLAAATDADYQIAEKLAVVGVTR